MLQLKSIVTHLMESIMADRVQPVQRARRLNSAVFFFLRDLLTFADRGAVFRMIHTAFRFVLGVWVVICIARVRC